MNTTIQTLIKKVSQLTERLNILYENSMKIHELPNSLGNAEELYIAVSDGTNTGKKEYRPSEIDREEFDDATSISLERIEGTNTIELKNGKGDVLSSLDIGFISSTSLILSADSENKKLLLMDEEENILSFVPFEDILLQPTHEYYTITESDLLNTSIEIKLINFPSLKEPITVYINGLFVNPDDFVLSDNILTIQRTNIGYDIKEGMKVTVNYKY